MALRMLQIKVEFAQWKKNHKKIADKRSVQMCTFHRRAARKKNRQQGNREVFRIPNYTNWSKLLCVGLCLWMEVNRILQNSTEMTPVILKKPHPCAINIFLNQHL